MSRFRQVQSVPPELGCTIGPELFSTPRWVAFKAERDGRPASLWALLPATISELRNPLVPMPKAARTRYDPLAGEAEAALVKLAGAEAWKPRDTTAAARSGVTGILWLRMAPANRMPAAGKPLDPMKVAALGREMAGELAVLHKAGLLHLEIDPSTIGADASGRLLGFGIDIRKTLAKDAATNAALGNARYAAPELLDRTGTSALGPWTDIHALAATLYQLLMDKPPPSYSDRLKDPEAGVELCSAILGRLAEAGMEDKGLAVGISLGLEPRPGDRQFDILDWAEELEVAPLPPPPPPVPPPPSPPPPTPTPMPTLTPPTGPSFKTREASVVELERHWIAPESAPARSTSGRTALILILIGLLIPLIALGAGGLYLAGVIGREDAPVPIASPTPTPTPTARQSPTPKATVQRIASGSLAGQAYADDPARFATLLGDLWLSGRASGPADRAAASEAAVALLRPFRESDDSLCKTPLRLHLRSDGKGLLIERPAGVIWVTSWKGGRENQNEITVSLDSIWDREGEIDAPGLAGSLRRIRWTGDGLEIMYIEDGEASSEREAFERCTIGI